MKKHFKFFLISTLILLINSCKEENGFEITAQVDGFEDQSRVLMSDIASQKVLDSAILKDGSFELSGSLDDTPSRISLLITSKDGKEGNYTSLFIGNESISLTGEKNSFDQSIDVSGSQHHKFKVDLDNQLRPFEEKRSSKLQEMFALRSAGKWNDSLQAAYWSDSGMITKIDNETAEITKTFIANNINSHFALSTLMADKHYFSKEFIQNQLDQLDPEFEETRYVKALQVYLASEPLKKGASFNNFYAEDQEGKAVDFASYFTNDKAYTLLEFYSPHCSWCKKALPEIKKLETDEKEKLQVITYNVDKSKEDWLNSTRSNDITWTTLWNEEGRYSDAYMKYQIVGTPTYLLFDEKGRVLRRWNGYDEDIMADIRKAIE